MDERTSARHALIAAVAGVVFIAAVFGALRSGDDEVEVAVVTTTTTTTGVPLTVTTLPGTPRAIPGFEPVGYQVRLPDGTQMQKCAALAETPEQLAQGMMRQTTLGGYDAMVFRFAEDTTAQFFMANVPVPLSVAWYAADGTFVEALDMPVCTEAAELCPRFGPGRPYRLAFETLQGGLAGAGLVAGSTVTVGGPCA